MNLFPIITIRIRVRTKNNFISEKKCNIIIMFVKYITYSYFLETAVTGTAA